MWLSDNLWKLLIFAGLAILALEVIVFSLSTFVLFFVGLGALITGLMMWLGILPQTMIAALGGIGLISGGLAIILWKPLKNFQNQVEDKPTSNDLVGLTFMLETDIGPGQPGTHAYSGITWRVVASQHIAAGTRVQVVKTEVGELSVAPA